jgi:hypothetical protein
VDLRALATRLPRLDQAGSDRVWGAIIEHARTQGPDWTTVATGLAHRHLWSVVTRVSRGRPFGSRREEVEAEVIAAWIAEVRQVDTHQPDIAGRMWAATYRAGQRWRYAATRDLAQLTGTPVSAAHVDEGGHPEVALLRAVAAGVVTPVEAELIAATRIGRHTLLEVCDQLRVPYSTAKRRRRRAEAAVTAWLREEMSA